MKALLTTLVLSYLRFFAKKSLALHKPTIIGIAGSVGKSSTRNAVEAILKDHFPTKSVGNSETGIPLGILGMKPENYSPLDWLIMLIKAPFSLNYLKGTKYLIAEMGIDEPNPPKNMAYLLSILKPDIALSLNVSATHSLQFDKTVKDPTLTGESRLQKVIQNIAEEDTKIITQSGCSLGIYNADDENIARHVKDVKGSTRLLTFGQKETNDCYFGTYTVSLKGSTFTLFLKDADQQHSLTLSFPQSILPEEYREVFAAAILTARQTGLTLDQITHSLEKNYEPPKGRSSLFHGLNGSIIIDSSYNASKASTVAFLELVSTLKKETKRPVVMLLGDMRELGKESQIEHEEVAHTLVGIVDYLYLVGPLTREYVLPVIQHFEGTFQEMRWFDSSIRAGDYLKDNLAKDAIVLVKGSQNTIYLEEAIKYILKDKKDEKNLCRQDDFWLKKKGVI